MFIRHRPWRALIRYGLAALVVAGFASQVQAGQIQQAALSPADRGNVERALAYLNNISTLRARFVQVSSNGTYAEGEVSIARPGRLRFDYDPPVPALLIANGISLLFYDRELKQASFLPLWETPLWFLLREEVKLSDDMRVESVTQELGTLRIALRDAGNPDIGEVTLVFEDRPLALRKWQIVDAQGVSTEVSLIDPRFGVEIDPAVFEHGDLEITTPGLRDR